MAYKQLKLWFDAELAQLLADKLTHAGADFNTAAFVAAVHNGVGPLELKDRVALISTAMNEHLPGSYAQKAGHMVQALGPVNTLETGMFKEFYWVMPIAKFVEDYGLNDFEVSMDAIAELTQRSTGEFAIRPYLLQHRDATLAVMEQWAQSPSSHLRRLASEGVRIRLPWAQKMHQFVDDPTPIITILEHLKDDPSKYVQTSVANNLNDLLKDNYPAGEAVIERWAANAGKQRMWIIKHALRNQRKAANPWALGLLAKFNK